MSNAATFKGKGPGGADLVGWLDPTTGQRFPTDGAGFIAGAVPLWGPPPTTTPAGTSGPLPPGAPPVAPLPLPGTSVAANVSANAQPIKIKGLRGTIKPGDPLFAEASAGNLRVFKGQLFHTPSGARLEGGGSAVVPRGGELALAKEALTPAGFTDIERSSRGLEKFQEFLPIAAGVTAGVFGLSSLFGGGTTAAGAAGGAETLSAADAALFAGLDAPLATSAVTGGAAAGGGFLETLLRGGRTAASSALKFAKSNPLLAIAGVSQLGALLSPGGGGGGARAGEIPTGTITPPQLDFSGFAGDTFDSESGSLVSGEFFDENAARFAEGFRQGAPLTIEAAGQLNTFAAQQFTEALFGTVPGFEDIIAQLSENVQSQLRGELPADVEALVRMSAAETRFRTGLGESPIGSNITPRDLGLTSLDVVARGEQGAFNLLGFARESLLPPQVDVTRVGPQVGLEAAAAAAPQASALLQYSLGVNRMNLDAQLAQAELDMDAQVSNLNLQFEQYAIDQNSRNAERVRENQRETAWLQGLFGIGSTYLASNIISDNRSFT